MSEVEVPVETKVDRIVALEDGTTANFGIRSNVLSSIDVATDSVKFRFITGKVNNWVVEGIDNLTDEQKLVYLYGLLAKVKVSVASVKEVSKLQETVAKTIEAIKTKGFSLRLSEEAESALTDIQKAFALAISNEHFTPVYDASKAHWADIENPTVVAEVISLWDSFDKTKKNSIRSNPFVRVTLDNMKIAAGDVESLL